MHNQKKAYIFGLVTVGLWSTVASAFKISLQHLSPEMLLLYSSLVSILTLAAISIVQGNFRTLFKQNLNSWKKALGMGFLNPFAYYLILFKAYDLLPAQEAQPINYTWAVTLALLSIPLLGQKLSRFDIIATAICYMGVYVISTHGDILGFSFSNLYGVALALGSTVIWALYWIFSMKDDRPPVTGLLMNFLCGFPFIAAFALYSSPLCIPSSTGILGATYVGMFEMGVTFVTWLTALRLSENTSRVGNLIFISPFLSLFLISHIVGKPILPSTYIGLVLIVAGLIVQQRGNATRS